MSEPQQWAFQDAVQPKLAETPFDLARALDSMVLLRAEVPSDGYTVANLGTERGGYGAVISEDGLVLTIGYLVNEASQIWLTSNRGQVIEGYRLAYDHTTGFGLVQPLGKLDAPPLSRGRAADAKVGETAYALGHGGLAHALKTEIVAKQEFAGSWEYVLDEALFTSPAHPQWGGAALLDARGKLIGTGSLLVQHEHKGEAVHANMFVPVDLLEPILDGMVRTGRSPAPAQPWLGMSTQESDGKLMVMKLTTGGPADRAGVKPGDLVLKVGSTKVTELPQMFRTIRQLGAAGVEVPLTIARGGDVLHIPVASAERSDFLKKPNLH